MRWHRAGGVGHVPGETMFDKRFHLEVQMDDICTGLCQIGLDPSDPYPEGFTLTDTWMGPV